MGGLTRRATLGLAAGAGLAASGCAGGDRFVIGFQKNGVLLAAKHRGDIEAALNAVPDVNLDWAEFASGPPLLEALGAGAVHLGQTGDLPTIFAQAGGGDLLYVAAVPLAGQSAAILAPADSPIRQVAQLRGKRVAFTRGSSAQPFVQAALARAGMTMADIEAVDLTPPDASAAFASNRVDAWAIWDPYYAQVEVKNGARPLTTARGVSDSSAFVLANRQFTNARPDVIRAALDAMRATAEWAKTDRRELGRIFAVETGQDPDVQARVAERQDLEMLPMNDAAIARHQALADQMFKDGVIPRKVDVASAAWRGWTPRAAAA
jgi:aliphatic sulfonates family ABC transporter substrate-binding protein